MKFTLAVELDPKDVLEVESLDGFDLNEFVDFVDSHVISKMVDVDGKLRLTIPEEPTDVDVREDSSTTVTYELTFRK